MDCRRQQRECPSRTVRPGSTANDFHRVVGFENVGEGFVIWVADGDGGGRIGRDEKLRPIMEPFSVSMKWGPQFTVSGTVVPCRNRH